MAYVFFLPEELLSFPLLAVQLSPGSKSRLNLSSSALCIFRHLLKTLQFTGEMANKKIITVFLTKSLLFLQFKQMCTCFHILKLGTLLYYKNKMKPKIRLKLHKLKQTDT